MEVKKKNLGSADEVIIGKTGEAYLQALDNGERRPKVKISGTLR